MEMSKEKSTHHPPFMVFDNKSITNDVKCSIQGYNTDIVTQSNKTGSVG